MRAPVARSNMICPAKTQPRPRVRFGFGRRLRPPGQEQRIWSDKLCLERCPDLVFASFSTALISAACARTSGRSDSASAAAGAYEGDRAEQVGRAGDREEQIKAPGYQGRRTGRQVPSESTARPCGERGHHAPNRFRTQEKPGNQKPSEFSSCVLPPRGRRRSMNQCRRAQVVPDPAPDAAT
jgi:hypothetical protein